MDLLDDKETCKLIDFDDDADFKKFLESGSFGLKFIAEKDKQSGETFLKEKVGDFSKWLKENNPQITVDIPKVDRKHVLRNTDFWFPLAYIANDIGLPVYLSLVSNYIYDRMKGALKGEKGRVHLEVTYDDNNKGVSKKFKFDGYVDDLEKTIKKIDVNKFMEE